VNAAAPGSGLDRVGERRNPRPPTGPAVGLSAAALRDAVRFLNDRVTTGASVAEVAAAVRLSPFHFARMFKRRVGLGPHQFLIRLRVRRVKRVLAGGAAAGPLPSLAQLAAACGFADQSHMCRHFKRVTGQTPTGYQRRLRRRRLRATRHLQSPVGGAHSGSATPAHSAGTRPVKIP
jgi:transcriptional regulator GlxA family with amidase domain